MTQIFQSRWIDILWCLCITAYILAGIQDVPLHGDESTQIYMGRDFYYHIQGNTAQVLFQDWDTLSGDEATEQQLRLLNGTIPKYLFGALAYLSHYDIEDINQQWSWGSGWEWNHTNEHVPTEDLLFRSRFVSASLLAISAIALFAVGNVLSGRFVAYIASAYYVVNPAILLNGRRAMMEGGMLAFSMLVILIALYLLKNRLWWQYILLGVISGLAVASKHTSVITIISIFAVCGGYFLLNHRKHLLNLLGSGILSLIVFFALNPAWWNAPLTTPSTVLELRQDLLSGQVSFFGGYDNFSDQVSGFARQSFIVLPIYADSDFDDFYSAQLETIQNYDSSLLSGVSLGGSTIGGLIVFILTIAGLARLWLYENIKVAHRWLITTWFISMIILTLFLTPLEWQRYYLPIYPVIGILFATGVEFLWHSLNVARLFPLQNPRN